MSSGQRSELMNMLAKNSSNQSRNGAQNKGQNDEQQPQQQLPAQHDALASLLRSLSNLAHNGGSVGCSGIAGHPSHSQSLNINHCPSTASNLMNLTLKNLETNEMSGPTSAPLSIPTSLHGVVAAAALMQQQLVNAAINQEYQQTQAPSVQAPSQLINTCQTSVSQIQSTSKVPFLGHPSSSASNHLVSYPDSLVGGLDQDVQYTTSEYNTQQNQPLQPPPPQHQQLQQRINYCTICNKELCNKYFMKTHMLKMHGINLETEQSGGEDESSQSHSADTANRSVDEPQRSPTNNSTSGKHPRQQASKNPTFIGDGQSQDNQQPGTPNKSKLTTSTTSNKSATSVMNGFAGNSMGGVVCDICNKELCSKYFLKVHKQNTHGILTDYQDASQFVYPFSNNLPNPFMSPQMNLSTNNMLSFSANTPFNHNNSQTSERKPPATKKARLMPTNRHQSKDRSSFESGLSVDSGKPDSTHGLLLNQHQPPNVGSSGCQFAAPIFESVAANPMSALMCFGSIGPFGPASISPTMVVEIILRNQHLINRNKGIAPIQGQTTPGKSCGKDKNNNDSKQTRATTGKGTKDGAANSGRYFTHYTEACPMCDRRFKSIKWLKTHMMNDHKQEIGTYMQMIMQNLYAPKGQPINPLVGPPYDQAPKYPPVNLSSCNNMVIPQQHQQQQHFQQSQPTPTISYNNLEPQNTGTVQAKQYNIVQDYLDQQRQLFHMQHQQQQQQQQQQDQQPKPEISHLTSESALCDQSTELITLNEAHHQAKSNSSSSSGHTTPQSLGISFACADNNQQLDLSMKFNFDNQPRASKRCPELVDDDDNYLNDEGEDSTRSSCNRGAKKRSLSTNAMETNDLSLVQVEASMDA